jgi:hypothetical protein
LPDLSGLPVGAFGGEAALHTASGVDFTVRVDPPEQPDQPAAGWQWRFGCDAADPNA